jgi:ankyrin repeat protein
MAGKLGVVRLLLDHGAEVDIRGEHNWTPLEAARERGHDDIVKLLSKGGHPSAKYDAEEVICRERVCRNRDGMDGLSDGVDGIRLHHSLGLSCSFLPVMCATVPVDIRLSAYHAYHASFRMFHLRRLYSVCRRIRK